MGRHCRRTVGWDERVGDMSRTPIYYLSPCSLPAPHCLKKSSEIEKKRMTCQFKAKDFDDEILLVLSASGGLSSKSHIP